jgi:hypothetical protein
MRFFTPELYVRFNSPDDEEADRANEEWEEAIRNYRERLEAIRGRMPAQVSKLADLCLHDAEVLARTEEFQAVGLSMSDEFPLPLSLWSAVAIISVKQGGEILSLIYSLCDRMRVFPSPDNWPFSKSREHWLYDEVDVVSDRRGGPFIHRILLSTGVVLEIPFTSVVIHRFAVPAGGNEGTSRQSA